MVVWDLANNYGFQWQFVLGFNHQVLWGIQWDARPAQMMINGLVFEPPPLTSTSQIVDDHPKAERKQTSTSNQPLGCFTFIG